METGGLKQICDCQHEQNFRSAFNQAANQTAFLSLLLVIILQLHKCKSALCTKAPGNLLLLLLHTCSKDEDTSPHLQTPTTATICIMSLVDWNCVSLG